MASRRAADVLIASGAVRVNGRVPPASGLLVDPEADRVTIDGEPIEPVRAHHYLALHKPAGVLVTARDPQDRPTVFDLVRGAGLPRLFAVGRLDGATSGLLLLTNDGELANRLSHPRHKVPKEYLAAVRGVPGERELRQLREGVLLDDGWTLPAEVEFVDSTNGLSRIRVVIREGRNRQVRRMLEAIGHPVLELTRTAFGPVRLGRLRPGGWRRLRPAEVTALREAARAAQAREAVGASSLSGTGQ
ncbi:MAG TPA: pseudouridine synthase [Candidatus Dormibacteraeota bacterium]|nr:pseudouridine synthase [Candidatus Dormibacteraeota bacterium]